MIPAFVANMINAFVAKIIPAFVANMINAFVAKMIRVFVAKIIRAFVAKKICVFAAKKIRAFVAPLSGRAKKKPQQCEAFKESGNDILSQVLPKYHLR
jgi:hypothetical protein